MISEAYQIGSYEIEVYDNPSVNLNPRLQDGLIQECMPVAKDGFGEQHMDEEVVRRHILKGSTSIVIRNEFGCAIGIAGSSLLKIDGVVVIYLQGAAISNEYRGLGLYKLTVASRITEEVKKIDEHCVKEQEILIGTRTQNPLVYKFMYRKLNLYPHPSGYVDGRIKNIASKVYRKIYDEYSDFKSSDQDLFDEDTFIARKSLGFVLQNREIGLNLYESNTPYCKDDDEINQYMKQNVNWNDGDALIMLGYYNQKDILKLCHLDDFATRTVVS